MVLSDSHISMRSICLNLLFTPIDYIFVICLMKCLSWLVGVWFRASSSIYICIIFSLLSFCFEGVIQFWAVTWDLGLKSGSNLRDADTTLGKIVHGHWHALSCERLEVKWLKTSVGPRGQLPEVLGWFSWVLQLMWKVCMLCFCRFHFLTITQEVESNHNSLSLHVYLGWLVSWVDVGGGCYKYHHVISLK